jgi:hypothetical protein
VLRRPFPIRGFQGAREKRRVTRGAGTMQCTPKRCDVFGGVRTVARDTLTFMLGFPGRKPLHYDQRQESRVLLRTCATTAAAP